MPVATPATGFVSATVLNEGDHSGVQDEHRARPWLGATGVAVNLGQGWRASLGYYASSRFGSASASRLVLALRSKMQRDSRKYDASSWDVIMNAWKISERAVILNRN